MVCRNVSPGHLANNVARVSAFVMASSLIQTMGMRNERRIYQKDHAKGGHVGYARN